MYKIKYIYQLDCHEYVEFIQEEKYDYKSKWHEHVESLQETWNEVTAFDPVVNAFVAGFQECRWEEQEQQFVYARSLQKENYAYELERREVEKNFKRKSNWVSTW